MNLYRIALALNKVNKRFHIPIGRNKYLLIGNTSNFGIQENDSLSGLEMNKAQQEYDNDNFIIDSSTRKKLIEFLYLEKFRMEI